MGSDCCLSTLSGTAGSVTACILERLWSPIERQVIYLVRYRSNLKTIRERARELEALKSDVLKSMKDADDKGEEIKAEVLNWHVETIQIEMDVEWLEEKIEKTNGCCHIWHLDWRSRRRLSRLAMKKTIDIDEHLPRGKFDSISFPARPADLRSLPTPDYVPLETLLNVINSIMDVLKDEKNKIIGVHGSGGIGKTTLMKQLVKQVDKEIHFDKVLLVRVTQTPNLRRIQDEIAKLVGFEIEGDVEYQRAATLSQRLKRWQTVLIILDDLWEKLDLATVGIPYGEEHKGCKVVITSRFEDVCNKMESNKNIQIEELSELDRLKLFKIKAGLPDSNAFDRASEEVVRRCGKLPNAIVIIGGALRNKPVNEWNDAIKKERDSATITVEGIPEEVVLCVTLGYDQLKEVAKSCLQFSCLFPPYYNVSMEELVIHGLVDRLFPGVESLGEVWIKMNSVVAELKSSNLLLEGDREGCYRTHDDTRKVIKFIASERGNNLMAEAGLRKGWPEEELQKCQKLSLMYSNVTWLPDQPECPQLITLFLQNNLLEDIPIRFFERMRALTFLDLSYTSISLLPLSLQCLEKLHSLRLENTHLRDASLIKEFQELEVLILRGSSIEHLPKGLETMTNLKLLDFSNNLFLKGIPPNLISKLSLLEELYVGNSFGDWEVEGTTNQQNAGFFEVASLARLTVLYIHVKNTSVLSTEFDGPWKNLKRFRICVNDDYWDIASTKSMHLKNLTNPLANWVKLLLEKTEYLTFTRSRDLEDVGKLDVEGINQLTCFHLRACSMDRVFSSSLYPRVQNLEELHVEYCYSLKEVFYLEEIEEERSGLTRLKELILVGLPKLMSLWKGNHSIAQLENLKMMKVKDCGKLRNLFSKTLAQKLHTLEHLAILKCGSLEEIVSNDNAEVGGETVQQMNLSNIPTPLFFQNLQKLIISKCNKMESVLPLTIVQGQNQLEELTVISCNQVERIITASGEVSEAECQNMLPKLKILALNDLRKLETVCNGEIAFRWPSLQELHVWDCPNLKRLPLASRSVPNMRKVRGQLSWYEDLQWKDEYTKIRLQSLFTEEYT
ncbi:hypothetical protein JRO89_XS15G0156200 [Xanthoceras sorbifolium]|uniref:AAA+ ATPase domain-containing protein n=1 Tax=Xanthoceras sorbifolium TaxID=99658 RepID=A0ABQ8H2D7_9ROSI|nr:hypothetical protein JRO89_XS15G0156200 [Xanthoceras sorbifolium]